MLKLRVYQTAAVAEIQSNIEAGVRAQILVLPTGGGKTETAAGLIAAMCSGERPALFVVEREVLVKQTVERFRRHGHVVGIIHADHSFIPVNADVIVGTVQTLRSRWAKRLYYGCARTGEQFVQGCGLVVVDECDVLHRTHVAIMNMVKAAGTYVIGLTATPLRDALGKHYDKIVAPVTIRQLQDMGFLVIAKTFAPTKSDLEQALRDVQIRRGDYVESQLSAVMQRKALVGDIVATWKERAPGLRTILFGVDCAHALAVCEEFQSAGVAAGYIDAFIDDDDRLELYSKLRSREISVLCSVGVLTRGFDLPETECVILARPTKSLALYIQMVGRGLRPAPGKDHVVILDHSSNTHEHGLAADFTPPDSLDEGDEGWKQAKPEEMRDLVTCNACGFVYPIEEIDCPECGHARVKRNGVVWLDGELVQYDIDREPEVAAQGHAPERVRLLYSNLRWIIQTRYPTWSKGAAFYRLLEMLKVPKSAIKFDWSRDTPQPPDPDTARWLTNHLKRQCIAYHKAREAA